MLFSFVLRCNQLELTSRTFSPEHNQCPRARIKCGTEEIELGHRRNPHAKGSSTGFPEEYSSSGFTAGSKDVEVALQNHTALKLHFRQKMTSEY